jgi:hypothetical protein
MRRHIKAQLVGNLELDLRAHGVYDDWFLGFVAWDMF